MTEETVEKINRFFLNNPIAKGTPASQKEITDAEVKLDIKFDPDYTYFQLNYGGSMIKAKEIYGLHNSELMGNETIIELTKTYRENVDGEKGWLIIGTDYAGNFIGIDKNGTVLCYDHDFGGLNILAISFEEYIIQAFAQD